MLYEPSNSRVGVETHSCLLGTGATNPDAVDVHAVALFLFAQVYVRRHHAAAQQPSMDVWPTSPSGEGGSSSPEGPSSPGRNRTNHTGDSQCLSQPDSWCMTVAAAVPTYLRI